MRDESIQFNETLQREPTSHVQSKGYRRAFEGRWRLPKQRDELRTYRREQARDETEVTMQRIKKILASCLGHFQVGSYRYRSLIEGLYIPSRSLVEAL